MKERLQKILSAAGVCSRRAAEGYLTAGRVTVNGVPATLGDQADPDCDAIAVDGVLLQPRTPRVWIMLYKPRGYVTTLSDEQGRKDVSLLVADCGSRVWPVGRLDLDSEGLLLMTNDGDMTQKLLHPSHGVEKEYHVWTTGPLARALPVLQKPMMLDGVPLRPGRVEVLRHQGESAELSFVIQEGKKRQVRRMCALAGLTVVRLKRVREGNLRLDPGLKPAQWRHLTREEVQSLYEL